MLNFCPRTRRIVPRASLANRFNKQNIRKIVCVGAFDRFFPAARCRRVCFDCILCIERHTTRDDSVCFHCPAGEAGRAAAETSVRHKFALIIMAGMAVMPLNHFDVDASALKFNSFGSAISMRRFGRR